MKPHAFLFLAGALAAPTLFGQTPDGRASWVEALHLSAAGTVATVDNLSRTSDPATRQDAETLELALSSAHPRQLTPSVLLVINGEVSSLHVADYSLNDHHRFGVRASVQKKFGLGPQAPVLQFGAKASFKDTRLDDDRGWTTEARLELAKRVLPNLRLAAHAAWLEHTARRDVFDLGQHSFGADVTWDVNDRWSLAGSIGRLEGDIVANAAWSVWSTMLAGGFGQEIFNYYTSRPWRTTGLFGSGWVSYNVEADVDLWSATLSYAATDRTSVELRHSQADVVNRVGVAYPTDSWALGVSHRF